MPNNREIYNHHCSYAPETLWSEGPTAYDRRMVEIRRSAVARHGSGRDVLDVCCGSGAYLLPMLGRVRSAVGIDFSSSMLDGFRQKLGAAKPPNLTLIEADVQSLPLPEACVDFAYSFASLYYVPRVDLAVSEIARVLRPGGSAILELGNLFSINTLIAAGYHEELGWAKSHHIPYSKMREYLRVANLEVSEWRSFQLFPMYGAPRRQLWLYPIAHPAWKRVMGIEVGGKMIDEWVSSSAPFRRLSFRHMITVRKR